MNIPDWEARSRELAYLVYRLMEGDIPDTSILYEYGFIDEDGDWIYGQEDE